MQAGKWNFSTNGIYWAGKAGIPSIGFGPGEEETAHTVSDSVLLDDVVKATEFYALLPALLAGAHCHGLGPGDGGLMRDDPS